jgi:hypothetical protein
VTKTKIRAQWAIGQAINLASVKMRKEDITMDIIKQYAKELYTAVYTVQGKPVPTDDQEGAYDFIDRMSG